MHITTAELDFNSSSGKKRPDEVTIIFVVATVGNCEDGDEVLPEVIDVVVAIVGRREGDKDGEAERAELKPVDT